jgi:hypothetical protein
MWGSMCPKEPHVRLNISYKVCGAEYPKVLYVMLDISYKAPCGPGYPTVLHLALDISCRAQFGAVYTFTDMYPTDSLRGDGDIPQSFLYI